MPLESTQHQQLLSVYSMPGTEEWDWARQILPPEEFTHPLGETYVIGRQMGPVGHERAQNPVCGWQRDSASVYWGGKRGSGTISLDLWGRKEGRSREEIKSRRYILECSLVRAPRMWGLRLWSKQEPDCAELVHRQNIYLGPEGNGEPLKVLKQAMTMSDVLLEAVSLL